MSSRARLRTGSLSFDVKGGAASVPRRRQIKIRKPSAGRLRPVQLCHGKRYNRDMEVRSRA